MPVSVNFHGLETRIQSRRKALEDPGLVEFLAQRLSLMIAAAYYDSGLKNVTGTLMNNLRYVGDPERTAHGWSIQVGKGMGSSKDHAPKGTIKAFLEWYRGRVSKKKERPGQSWAFAWWYLSQKEKAALQQQRESGKFGGETTYAVERSPYIWSHDDGNSRANIRARGFINEGIARWRKNTREYVAQYMELNQS